MYHLIINSLIENEKAEKLLDVVKEVFRKAGKELSVHQTEYPGHAIEIVAGLTAGGKFAHLIAMGGDGTLHEVLNGIENVENCTLGLIPYGNGNDFAAAAGISDDVKFAAENIVFRAPRTIDFIQLESGLRSINAVGMGIDVDVLKRAYASSNNGKGKYLAAFLQSIKNYQCSSFKVSYDGGEESVHHGFIACLGNGKQIGGGIKLFPDAKIDDGYMDLLVVDYLSRFKMLMALSKLKRGKINRIKGVTHVKCKTASVRPLQDTDPIQAEGEIYEGMTIDAEIISGKLKFYIPEHD